MRHIDPDNPKHECAEVDRAERLHSGFYGPAISEIEFYEGYWWANADAEYSTRIRYCPFCGIELEPPE